jgi:zinc protease
MVIVVVGAAHPEAAVEQVSRILGDWLNPDQPELPDLPPVIELSGPARQHVEIPGKSQSDLVMGSLGPSRLSSDYFPASLGNNILGQFGMYGRIGDVVREQSGLAYYAYTSLNAGIGPGSWEVSAGVNPVNVDKTIELVQTEIRRFVSEPVTPEELKDSQANFIGRLPISLESNNGMANALLNLERYDLGLDYYRRYAGLVQAVTPEQILETAQRYLKPECLAMATAGSST